MLRVEVRWIDSGAWFDSGWKTKDRIVSESSLSEVATVGWLMNEDDDTYYIASSYDPTNEHFYGVQLIHKPAVTGFIRLRARTISATEEDDQEG